MRVAKDMQLLMLKICGLRTVNTILGKNDSVGLENNDASDAESSRCSFDAGISHKYNGNEKSVFLIRYYDFS